MKKKLTLVMACMLLFNAIFACSSIPVQAGTKTKITSTGKKAIKAYQRFLGQDTIQWSYQKKVYAFEKIEFALADINSDGVPELLLENGYASHAEGYVAIYGYYKKKIRQIDIGADEITSYYPKSGIVEFNHYGMGGTTWYRRILKNTKQQDVATIQCPSPYGAGDKTAYHWNKGKKEIEVSKVKFYRLLKKATGKKRVKIKDSDWHSNTADNRKNMVKFLKK